MNRESNLQLPGPIADHETTWLDSFGDGELTSSQKDELFQYLDAIDGWKRCAHHLAHERLLAVELKSTANRQVLPTYHTNVLGTGAETSKPVQSELSRSQFATSILAAGIAFVLGAASFWFLLDYRMSGDNQESKAVANSTSLNTGTVTGTSSAGEVRQASYQPPESALTFFEIEDTPVRATYYLQQPLPEVFLSALVLAGHSVEVGQDSMSVVGPDGTLKMLPINTLQIRKVPDTQF